MWQNPGTILNTGQAARILSFDLGPLADHPYAEGFRHFDRELANGSSRMEDRPTLAWLETPPQGWQPHGLYESRDAALPCSWSLADAAAASANLSINPHNAALSPYLASLGHPIVPLWSIAASGAGLRAWRWFNPPGDCTHFATPSPFFLVASQLILTLLTSPSAVPTSLDDSQSGLPAHATPQQRAAGDAHNKRTPSLAVASHVARRRRLTVMLVSAMTPDAFWRSDPRSCQLSAHSGTPPGATNRKFHSSIRHELMMNASKAVVMHFRWNGTLLAVCKPCPAQRPAATSGEERRASCELQYACSKAPYGGGTVDVDVEAVL